MRLVKTGMHRQETPDPCFDRGIERALRAILVSPDFLFRIERDPQNAAPGTVHRISDLDLASRLSFFLWSSIPDDQLLTLATECKLSKPAVLQAQVTRMLDDPRSKAFVSNFAGQWLYLRNLAQVRPDPDLFPTFDATLSAAFREETDLFVDAIMRENRPVTDLLSANFTYLNERLAESLRYPRCLRIAVPPGRIERSFPWRAPGPRQHFDRDLVSEPYLRGAARQVGA